MRNSDNFPPCVPLNDGITPPPYYTVQEAVPCACGHVVVKGDGSYEFFDMKMVSDDSPLQVPPRRTARCKTCKEILITKTVYKDNSL